MDEIFNRIRSLFNALRPIVARLVWFFLIITFLAWLWMEVNDILYWSATGDERIFEK